MPQCYASVGRVCKVKDRKIVRLSVVWLTKGGYNNPQLFSWKAIGNRSQFGIAIN